MRKYKKSDRKSIAKKICELTAKYPSDYEAAEDIGVRRETLSRWKHGVSVPRGVLVLNRLRDLGVSID